MSKIRIERVSTLLQRGFSREVLIDEFVKVNAAAWPPPVPERYLWTKEKISAQIQNCPRLLFCAFVDGKIIGTLSVIHISKEDALATEDWEKISGYGTLSTHQQDGDSAFGLDLSVKPEAQGIGTADKLIQKAFMLTVILEKKRGAFLGSRIPRFHKRANEMTVEDYVFGTNGKTRDPEIRLYQSEGFQIVKIVPGYMEDPESLDYGILMFYPNPAYKYTSWMPDWVLRCIGRVAEKFL